jgi:hypothetical protein
MVSTNVFAELTVLKYDNMSKAEKDSYRMYINGLVTGAQWMMIVFGNESNKLYCQPDKLALNTDNNVDILKRRINKIKSLNYDLSKSYIEMEIIEGLIDTFPCKK